MNEIKNEIIELTAEVAAALTHAADLIDHYAIGLEAGVPQSVVIAAMKQASADLRGQALQP